VEVFAFGAERAELARASAATISKKPEGLC
jgi:hypothetical protein